MHIRLKDNNDKVVRGTGSPVGVAGLGKGALTFNFSFRGWGR